MIQPTSLRHWVNEAIQTLGYLKPETAEKIVQMAKKNSEQHPRAIATAYRKAGEQLTADEKKRLGLRANAFMSKAAMADLTAKGLAAPLAAHETTILCATLAHSRVANLTNEKALGITSWECVAAFEKECPGCARMKGQVFSAGEVLPTGPQDCFREACATVYIPKVNFQELRAKEVECRSGPWWKFW